MKLIVGLGNPGFRYRSTRHNVGYMVLDGLAGQNKVRIRNRKHNSVCGAGNIAGEGVLLAKPLTFMNLSGHAVSLIIKKENISLEDILIISDDTALELGSIRFRERGSSGGHKGIGSVIDELKTQDFQRLRIGIGAKKGEMPLSDYVLAPFRRSEQSSLNDTIQKSCGCIETWIRQGAQAAMAKYNIKMS